MVCSGEEGGWERGGGMGMGGVASRRLLCKRPAGGCGSFLCLRWGREGGCVFSHLPPRAARWNDFLYFSCNSWRIMRRKTLPGNSPSVEMRPREE